MNCPIDDAKLKVTHVYVTNTNHKTQRAVCPKCGKSFTIVSMLLVDGVDGAWRMAEKLRKGERKIVIAEGSDREL